MAKGNIEEEYNEINSKKGWNSLFKEIREKSEKEAKEKSYSVSESLKAISLNRYRDVNPYDHSRIVIHRGKTDYINANLVEMEKAGRKYILTQGPLRETIGHFWLMVWEQNTKAILMLNKLVEQTVVKCHMYWPEKIGEEHILNLSEVGLTIEYLKSEEYTNFCKRIFKVTDVESKKSREVIQFHYTTWPDFGIPSSPVAFLQFLKQVRDSGALDPEYGPAVVHCSAGIGRSGTFCLVDCSLVLIDKEGENKVSVQDVLYELRRYRMGLIQTPSQLYFSYQAIIDGIKLLKDPSFMDYEEVPIISKDEYVDETPPPLPPRTHSLHLTTTINKPLPTIPNSESLHEDFISNLNDANAVKNFINNEKNSEHETSNLNRPLPPIPKGNSLEKVAESDSDDEVYDLSIEDDTSALLDDDSESGEVPDIDNAEKIDNGNNMTNVNPKPVQNGVESTNSCNNYDGAENVELKRRKRVERQAIIEKKVNEIKRKQREVEEDTRKSSKKRRSLTIVIAAAVLVGAVCVYAYSKFG